MEPTPITTLDKARMDAVRELAEVNLKVSEGRNALEELKGLEASYLQEREGKAAASVLRVLSESQDILDIATENNDAVRGLAAGASGLAGKVSDLLTAVKEVLARFDQKSALWEKNMADREAKLDEGKKSLMLQKQVLEGERKSLDSLAGYLNDQEARVDSKRQEVNAMITNKDV